MAQQRYPIVLYFRYDKYKDCDYLVKNLKCDVRIINSKKDLEKLYDNHHHILATYGPNGDEYIRDVTSVICSRMHKRWIHYTAIDPAQFERGVNFCFIDNVVNNREACRPVFSIFTTCYNSFEKIDRPFKSLKNQTEKDWEWVIVDDSTDDTHFAFLKRKFRDEPKIRLFNRSGNSGSIGNVKNEAIALCRGKYILELDHDDDILPDLIKDAVDGFNRFPDVGFVYMDFCNLYENGNNFSYGDFSSKGYAGYYYQFYMGKWVKVLSTPQINNITMSHLFCMPNHPRIWKRELLLKIGSYSEFLPICDDLEVLLRTCYATKMLKIPKMAYVQYFNEVGNFSLIRNEEINRLGPQFIVPQSKQVNNFDKRFQDLGGWEDPSFDYCPVQIWKRSSDPKYVNALYHPDFDLQVGIIGLESLLSNIDKIQELYKNIRADFLVLDNNCSENIIKGVLEEKKLERMRFYVLNGDTNEQLVNYFNRVYKSINNTIIITDRNVVIETPMVFRNEYGNIFNNLAIELPEQEQAQKYIKEDSIVLELGARYGSVSCAINKKLKTKTNQVSVEPDPNIWNSLNVNKLNNRCEFHILKGAISQKPLSLIHSGYATRSVVSENGNVHNFTLEEVEEKYNLQFNTLVADCEGFLEQFMDENPKLYRQLKLIMFEKDFPDRCNYDKIITNLKQHNFINLLTGLHEVWEKPGNVIDIGLN